MAIDKSHTKPWMKAVIIFIALTFVIGIGFTGAVGACSATQSATPGATTGSATTTQTIAAIGVQYTPIIQALEASITADPKNYTLLVQQAQNYYQWGAQVRQADNPAAPTGQDLPIWKSAATFYARALKVKSGDPTVMGDYAVALFYSGDATGAIAEGEKVRAIDPKFAPNLFNLGIFYGSVNDVAKAKAAYEAYLVVEPAGQSAQAAKDNLAALAAAPATPSTPATP